MIKSVIGYSIINYMKNYLPERIKERRIRLGLRQEDLAKIANLTQAQISKYERGENEPSIEMIFVLAQILETSADYLIGLTDVAMPIDREPYLTEAEWQLVQIYRSKSTEGQQRLLDVAKVVWPCFLRFRHCSHNIVPATCPTRISTPKKVNISEAVHVEKSINPIQPKVWNYDSRGVR